MVTPPPTARSSAASSGQNECSARIPAVMGSVSSLRSSWPSVSGTGETPMCECGSMMPGVTNLPRASTTTAPAGGGGPSPSPTAAISLPIIKTKPGSKRWPAAVITVACWTSTGVVIRDSAASIGMRALDSVAAKGSGSDVGAAGVRACVETARGGSHPAARSGGASAKETAVRAARTVRNRFDTRRPLTLSDIGRVSHLRANRASRPSPSAPSRGGGRGPVRKLKNLNLSRRNAAERGMAWSIFSLLSARPGKQESRCPIE